MERQCWANAQYSRRECLEVAGIPRDVSNENLESKVLEVFSKVVCEILSRDIEKYHRLANNDRVIVKFLRRKDCDQVLSVKRDLRKIKLEDIGWRGSNYIFINPSLCPYYRMLWSKSKRLLDLGKINNFYVSSGKIKIRIQESSKSLSVTHVEDFKKYFSDVDLTPSLWRKLLISSYLISSSARCCVTTMYSYYELFKDVYHGYVETNHFISICNQSDWNPWIACLLRLYV